MECNAFDHVLDSGFDNLLRIPQEASVRRKRRQVPTADSLQLDVNFTVINPSAANLGKFGNVLNIDQLHIWGNYDTINHQECVC